MQHTATLPLTLYLTKKKQYHFLNNKIFNVLSFT